MNVLIACEESQRVCSAFRDKGHNAFSCDIIEESGGHPEWHIKADVLPLLNGNCIFKTCDGKEHEIKGKWDMILAFPPCTHLAVSGARHFAQKREDGRQKDAIEFFGKILDADCNKICVENPVNIIGGNYILEWFPTLQTKYNFHKCTQRIHPYYFGDPFKKTTCLWLKNLPLLKPTDMVEPETDYVYTNGKHYPMWMMKSINSENRSIERSKTFLGIAKAMAEQWG